MLYLDLVMSLMRLILYLIFIGTMFKIHTLPIFALRPMYLAIRKFRKSLSDIVLSRRAIAQLEIYPNATEEELANDNTCIICREEMVPGSRYFLICLFRDHQMVIQCEKTPMWSHFPCSMSSILVPTTTNVPDLSSGCSWSLQSKCK